jgi:hypothetical protein
MPVIHLILDGDNAWPELAPDPAGRERIYVVHLPDAVWQLAALPGGMESGAPSLALRLDLPDGRVVLAETSLAAWITATAALRGRFPEAFAGGPFEAPR